MLHRVTQLALAAVALLFIANGNLEAGRRGGCGGGGHGRHGGGCGGGGCGGGGCGYGGGCGGGGCGGGYISGPGSCGGQFMGGQFMGGQFMGGYQFQHEHKEMKGGGEMKKGKGEEETAAPASLVVTLPADARLLIDGKETQSTSGQRVFSTPALQGGREFHYTLRAEVVRNGQTQQVTQRVAVRAGEETQVRLDIPGTTVAAE